MAKKETKPTLSKQTKQLYVLGGLLGFLALVAAYNFLGSSKPTPPAKPAVAQNGAPAGSQPAGQPETAKSTGKAAMFGPIEVLPIAYTTNVGDVSPSRNVFDYPKPPPPPPPKAKVVNTPPPPTINIGSVSPGQTIAGTSKAIPITVTGSIFPGDAVLFVNGQRVPSQRVSGTVLKATLPPASIASPGALQLEVKSASQPEKLWSAKIPFTLTPSPDPGETFVYTGRLGAQAVLAFKDATKRPALVTVGQTVNGSVPWKILAINDKQVELLDTRNDIRKSLALVDKAR